MVTIRNQEKSEIKRTGEIDRSEEIFEFYQFQENGLKLVAHRESVAGFDEDELETKISRQHKLLETGGKVFGAFDDKKLIAIASVENKKRGLPNGRCLELKVE